MEIEITQLLETDMFQFSHSAAEGGNNAGKETWQASLSGPRPLLNTEDEYQAFRDFALSSGGWSEEDIAGWGINELQALFLQWIAGDVRQCPAIIEGVKIYQHQAVTEKWFYSHESSDDFETGPFDSRSEAYQAASNEYYRVNCQPRAETLEEIDWLEYEEQARDGRISSNLFKTEEGKIYFSLSN